MTYGEDPDTYRRPIAEPEPNLAAWITGGVLALAVIFSVFLMFRSNDATTTASNVSNRPQRRWKTNSSWQIITTV